MLGIHAALIKINHKSGETIPFFCSAAAVTVTPTECLIVMRVRTICVALLEYSNVRAEIGKHAHTHASDGSNEEVT